MLNWTYDDRRADRGNYIAAYRGLVIAKSGIPGSINRIGNGRLENDRDFEVLRIDYVYPVVVVSISGRVLAVE